MRPCHCEKERLGWVGKRNGVEGEREEGKGGSRHTKLKSIVRLQSMYEFYLIKESVLLLSASGPSHCSKGRTVSWWSQMRHFTSLEYFSFPLNVNVNNPWYPQGGIFLLINPIKYFCSQEKKFTSLGGEDEANEQNGKMFKSHFGFANYANSIWRCPKVQFGIYKVKYLDFVSAVHRDQQSGKHSVILHGDRSQYSFLPASEAQSFSCSSLSC